MRQWILISMVWLMLLIGLPLGSMAANTKKKIAKVTEAVTISDNWDYTVTGDEPFADGGSIDIVNTEHAVVILEKVKPSAAIKLLAKYVTINGAKAVNNNNCQVKIYNCGAIILPYPDKQMLTVYSEPDFGGTSVNSFTTKNTGGYMNTLKDAELNNKIRSFKLKRGYMVTFSTQASGRGYSRCFIAADNDLEVASLPDVLDQKISSYRVFKWYDTGKKQLANFMDKTALSALNVQSSYEWGQGNSSFLPDYEWVPNHIYEDWPSSATIGGTSQSPHTKNNNEPRNSSDDHPQDLKTILDNWENMMRTGLRLCSPTSWDGSDYWNATGFLAEFLDSIDARGWRCDIIDLHCYWLEGNFGNIANWSNKYKRPVWISELCWGASRNKNGAFAAGVTKEQVKTALQGICTKLNSYAYVERYYYWNSEASISKLYEGGKLTPAGEYYASMTSPLAYNDKYNFVPATPRQYAPSKFKEVAGENGKVTKLNWYDSNGEYNRLMEVQKKTNEGLWVTLETIAQKETASNYTYNIPKGDNGTAYRLHVVDLNGKEYYIIDALTEIDGKNTYNLTYLVDGQTYKAISYQYGASITPEPAPTKQGYTFSGWSSIPGTMPANDVTVTGTFTKNTPTTYTLTYLVDGQTYKAVNYQYGATITPEPAPTKQGYTFSGWSSFPATMPANDVTVTGTFSKNTYKLTYMVDGQTYKTISYQYGASITPEPAPTKQGYTFSGWSAIPAAMPANDVTVTGTFIKNAATTYTLTYMVDGQVYKTFSYEAGAAVARVEAPTKEGYTFSGWSNTLLTMPERNVTITGTFTKNAPTTYKLTYMIDGKVYKASDYAAGAAIIAEPAPTKEGYTFSGWSTIPATMPAYDVTINGSFNKTASYTLTYMVNGEVYKTVSYEYGEKITPEPEPTKEGATFSGWSWIPSKMPDEDVVVTGTFDMEKYKLTYKVDGADYKILEVEIGSAITPEKEPTKDGYTFSGWSWIPKKMPDEDVTITGTFTPSTGVETAVGSGRPFDVYTVTGRKVRSQVTSLKGLKKGVYIVEGRKVVVSSAVK